MKVVIWNSSSEGGNEINRAQLFAEMELDHKSGCVWKLWPVRLFYATFGWKILSERENMTPWTGNQPLFADFAVVNLLKRILGLLVPQPLSIFPVSAKKRELLFWGIPNAPWNLFGGARFARGYLVMYPCSGCSPKFPQDPEIRLFRRLRLPTWCPGVKEMWVGQLNMETIKKW
mgnify:CR=1 FL=1